MQTLLSINNYYYPRGGAETVFLQHNEMLEAKGWRVAPFCMQHEKNMRSPWSSSFVERIEYGEELPAITARIRQGFKAVYSWESRSRIREILKTLKPDVCHAHNIYHHISPSILGVINEHGVPLVMTLHDLKIACPAYSMLTHDGICERCRNGGLYHVLTNRCMKGSFSLSALVMMESYLHRLLGSYRNNVSRFIVPSKFYFNKLVEWGFDPAKFAYVPNFVDAAAFRPEPKPGRRFVYFGRLSREKGVGTLIEAAARAGAALDIAGSGPAEQSLKQRAGELGADVRFLGFLSGGALHEAVRGARAVVTPSEWYENAPLSVLEAFALGKPVIASRIGGLPEIVIDGECGWQFEPGGVAGLSEALGNVMELSESELTRTGAAARERVSKHFSPSRYLADVRKIYGSLGVAWA